MAWHGEAKLDIARHTTTAGVLACTDQHSTKLQRTADKGQGRMQGRSG